MTKVWHLRTEGTKHAVPLDNSIAFRFNPPHDASVTHNGYIYNIVTDCHRPKGHY